jgi:Mlc titration factor MtfA (ptsG expression regulator)
VSDFGAPFDGRVSPYGGSSQLTWGNLPGGEHYGNVYLGDETRFQSGAMSLLLHETAHAVDRTLTPCGTDGDCPYNNLRRIFDHESINFRKSKKESDLITAYRMSSKEEFFAVGFDEYYCSGSSRKSLLSRYPSLFSLFRNLDK